MSADSTVYAVGALVVLVLTTLVVVFLPKAQRRETSGGTSPDDAAPSQDRVTTDVDTADLLSFFEGRDPARAQKLLAPYLGRWISLRVRLSEVVAGSDPLAVVAVDLTSKPADVDAATYVGTRLQCFFESQGRAEIETRQSGDMGRLSGRIKDVQDGVILLEGCELTNVESREIPVATSSAEAEPVAALTPFAPALETLAPETLAPMRTGEIPRPVAPSRPAEPAVRMFLNVSPAYLVDLCAERTPAEVDEATEPYLGKWLDVTLILSQVKDYPPGNCVFVNGRTSHLSDDAPESRPSTQDFACTFDRKLWLTHLEPRRAGDAIRVVGELANIGADGLRLIRCELPTANTSA